MLRKTLVVATAFLVTAALALPAAVTHPSVKGKVYAGYQGWFDAPGSGSPINNWVHWSGGAAPSPGHQTFEIYPDMRPYPANDQFRTGYADLGNGQPSTLFSSYVTQTVDLQFSWMQKFGIDGAALQRFTSDLVQPGSARYNQRNAVTAKARDAAQKYGRVNWFKAQGLYVIGGVPRGWRTDTNSKPGYAPVYQALNMVSPWNVGSRSVDGSLFAADLKALSARGQDYQPVIYPGFAWSNWNGPVHVPVQASTKLSYDLLCGGGVTVDLLYTDGTSAAGPDAVSATWTHVSRDLGAAAGKTISGIVVNTSGAHDASLDNLQIAS